jgi:hypothetical protein
MIESRIGFCKRMHSTFSGLPLTLYLKLLSAIEVNESIFSVFTGNSAQLSIENVCFEASLQHAFVID